MQLVIALLAFIVSFIVALFVYQKNPKSGTHVYFAALVFYISVYPVFNYLAVHAGDSGTALLWAKMILLVSIPQGPLLYFFAKTFPNNAFKFRPKLQLIILSWLSLNTLLALLGLIFKGVSVKNGTVSIQPGPLIPSFGLLHISTIVAGLYVLYKKYKKSIGQQRRQLGYIFYGIFVSFSLTFLITFVLPIILKNTVLLATSPIFLTAAVLAVAYAIVAQKLFDIRAAVARSVAYLLLVGLLALVYGIGLFGVVNVFFSGANQETTRQLLLIVLVVPLSLGFQQIRVFLNKITDKLFYRDSYDSQLILDQIGGLLVAEIRLRKIVQSTRIIVSDALKCSFMEFVLYKDGVPYLAAHEKEGIMTRMSLEELTQNLKKQENDAIVTDDLPHENKTKYILQSNQIAVSIRLVTQNQVVGYIVLGHKLSGSPYASKDLAVLKLISKELAVATQNALRFEQIENFNVTLQEKVNDATRELRKTNQKLKELDQAKDEFISMASHQLRTPLTSIKGYLSMLGEGDAGKLNATQYKFVDQAFISSQRMVYMISDLLNVSRIKTGKFVIETKPTYLPDVVETEIAQLYETVKARGLIMQFEKPDKFPTLMLDEIKVRQVIMNFADNAIYYTPKGTITIKLVELPKTIEFTVTDSGIGVPKKEQHHLFTKFYRADNAKRARPDGTGLGLFMAKKVIVAQGGSIIFSTTEGKGSTFGFSFDKTKIAVPAAVADAPAGMVKA